jgi:hypothetical protein
MEYTIIITLLFLGTLTPELPERHETGTWFQDYESCVKEVRLAGYEDDVDRVFARDKNGVPIIIRKLTCEVISNDA